MDTVARKKRKADEVRVLGTALYKAAEIMGFSEEEAAAVIGHERTSGIGDGIDPNSEAGERARMFIRVCRGLHTLVGGNYEHMRHWITTDNRAFGQSPREMMKSCQGLIAVLKYLDAMGSRL